MCAFANENMYTGIILFLLSDFTQIDPFVRIDFKNTLLHGYRYLLIFKFSVTGLILDRKTGIVPPLPCRHCYRCWALVQDGRRLTGFSA